MSTTNEHIPENVILDVLLEHQDFKDFKKVATTVTEIHRGNKASRRKA